VRFTSGLAVASLKALCGSEPPELLLDSGELARWGKTQDVDDITLIDPRQPVAFGHVGLVQSRPGVVRPLPRERNVVVRTWVLDLGRDADDAERGPRNNLVGRRKDHGGVRLDVAVTVGHRHQDDLAILIGNPTTPDRCPIPQGLDTGRSVHRAPRCVAPSSRFRP
jgi:hypothetical protein